MARVVVSGDELVGILRANGLIPAQIADIQFDDEEIRVLVDQMARERQRGVRARSQVARRCPRRRLGG